MIPIADSQFAQWVGAKGPSMHISAACASTTQAVGIAEDWIRAGRCKRVIVMASSDMSHYETHETAKTNDFKAIEAMLALDAEDMLKRVEKYHITMCGAAPVAAVITACNELGAKKAELVMYQTSGDVTGDYYKVVGYASLIIKK